MQNIQESKILHKKFQIHDSLRVVFNHDPNGSQGIQELTSSQPNSVAK